MPIKIIELRLCMYTMKTITFTINLFEEKKLISIFKNNFNVESIDENLYSIYTYY